MPLKEAMFYEKNKEFIKCHLCPNECVIKSGLVGRCGVRKNISGKLFSMNYGNPCTLAIDPIEKKPLFHFAPGSLTFSISAMGCNFSCLHCQNWEISQYPKLYGKILGNERSPGELFTEIMLSETEGASWTYTEPTVFYEYFYDTASLDKKKKFYQVWVTNGYTNPEPIKKASGMIDAVNVDYKGNDKFYRSICNARLEHVLKSMKLYKKLGIWIEIANLIIPGKNDEKDHILQMARWIRDNLGKETPLHISAYHPAFKMNIPATSPESIENAVKIADDYLDYVYAGNIRSNRENTYCPNCKTILIKRIGFHISEFNISRKGDIFKCPECGKVIPIAGVKWIPKKSRR